jgi:hypothetical protein
MSTIDCDNAELEKCLQEHVKCLVSHGAWFSPDLIISGHNGRLCIKSASVRKIRTSFIRVPLSLMPLKRDFAFTGKDGTLQCRPVSADVCDLHIQVMDQMIAMYNLCGKLADWSNASPLLALDRWPDVLAKVLETKKNVPKIKSYNELLQKGCKEELMVDSFLGSRIFNLNHHYMKELGYKDAEQGQAVFLPVIDYLNHWFQAENFAIKPEPAPVSMHISGKASSDAGEVFVRYNLYDPLDTFLFYGFVDTCSPWLASIPTRLDLPDGRQLDILNTGGVMKKQLPPQIKDLRLYIPTLQHHNQEVVRVNKLLIPGAGAPRALQRVLGVMLQGLDLGLDRTALVKWITFAEEALIETNRKWWKELEALTSGLPGDLPMKQDLQTLCSFSLGHLHSYLDNRPDLSG